MPKLTSSTPRYRLHRASGQAAVTLNGVHVYLGRHGSKASRAEYDRVIGEWLANGRQNPRFVDYPLTVVEVLAKYWQFAERHYRKNGQPTGELSNMRFAVRLLKQVYGRTPAREFGPLAIKSLQQRMIVDNLCRSQVNSRVSRIKRVFKWAVSEQLVPPSLFHGLQTVAGLQRGRSDARESQKIEPVDAATIEATLPHLPPVVGDMVRIQRLVGCRPGEICGLRPGDIDRSRDVWAYRPGSHKTEHHGRERVIFIGPRAQQVLLPYLIRGAAEFCFSPAESERIRKADLRAERKTKVQPSQRDRSKKSPRVQPADRYVKDSYNRAISRASKIAGAKHWSPNQLRHAVATEVRKHFGLEAAQSVLGHSKANTTEIYAARDQALAARVMQEVG